MPLGDAIRRELHRLEELGMDRPKGFPDRELMVRSLCWDYILPAAGCGEEEGYSVESNIYTPCSKKGDEDVY